ncbi:hypothetical protein AB0L99_07560 [Streptomyces sp. NPDC051954]|uniref:hypothetical protein n=1 Tax=Streptomyces sp. NPDC051954 TaxID=3155524 RepID=UPI00343516E5
MHIRSRTAGILATVVLTAGGLTAATAATASAAPAVAQSCYGSAKNYSTDSLLSWPAYPAWAYTTSNCADINVKPNSGTYVQTCFDPTSGANYCNAMRWIPAGTWGLAATDVNNGTKFYLQFDRANSGITAY